MNVLWGLFCGLLVGFAVGWLWSRSRWGKAAAVFSGISQAPESLLLSVNHDLRQPLQAMGLFITALRQRALPDDLSKLADRIEASHTAFVDEFDALIDMARLDEGRTVPVSSDFSLADLWSRLADDCAPLAEQRGQMLRFRAGPAEVLKGDLVLLQKVLRPLVVASLLSCEPGGTVLVGRRRRRGRLRIELWHGAPGMRDDLLRRILDPADEVAGKPSLTVRLVHRLCAAMNIRLNGRVNSGKGGVLAVEVLQP